MRFTSLIVELVRAKPRWIFWSAVLALALLWLIVPAVGFAAIRHRWTSIDPP